MLGGKRTSRNYQSPHMHLALLRQWQVWRQGPGLRGLLVLPKGQALLSLQTIPGLAKKRGSEDQGGRERSPGIGRQERDDMSLFTCTSSRRWLRPGMPGSRKQRETKAVGWDQTVQTDSVMENRGLSDKQTSRELESEEAMTSLGCYLVCLGSTSISCK